MTLRQLRAYDEEAVKHLAVESLRAMRDASAPWMDDEHREEALDGLRTAAGLESSGGLDVISFEDFKREMKRGV